MKTLALLPLLTTPLAAIPASTTLTLVDEPGINTLTVSVEPQLEGFPLSLASSSTSTLTGSMTAALDVDNATGTTTELTLSDGRVKGSTLTLRKSVIFVGEIYNIVIEGISAEIFTANPPGLVTPETGQFEASQHAFNIDQGMIGGTVSVPGESPVTIDESFSPESPVAGTGSGSGTVTLTPATTPEPDLYQRYIVVLTLPVDLDDTFDAGGNSIAVQATGTIKAAGTLDVPLSDYIAWTLDEGIGGADGQADANGDGVPNAIAWALGLSAEENATPFLPQATGGKTFTLTLPPGGTAAPLHLESSLRLSNWIDLPMISPIPAGSTGPVLIPTSIDDLGFLRLRVEE